MRWRHSTALRKADERGRRTPCVVSATSLAVGRIALALLLVVLNGFFVAAEFAFVRLRSASVETLVQDGRRGATAVKEATDNLDDYLAVSQLGITIASLGLGWVGEPAVAVLVDPLLEPVLPAPVRHTVTVALGFGIVTLLHVVYGELAPKTIAIQRAERVALVVAPVMKLFYYVFLPGTILFNGIATRSVQLIGVSPETEGHDTHTEPEILSVLSEASAAGRISPAEVSMIEHVFSLDDTTVREIMRPRPDVTSVSADTPLPELRTMAASGEYTRYPVTEGPDDDVIGFVDVKDILRASDAIDESGDVTARELSRPVVVVPETLRVDELLAEFQAEHRQMAVVIDEWGAFEGLATIEDALEVIVGDIRDQFDLATHAQSIEPRDDGGYEVPGAVSITELNDHLGTDFENEAVETVAGLVVSRLGHAPTVGDRAVIDTHTFRVTGVDGARITSLTVTPDS
ncbi:hemolysin family protein [Halobacterium salinarum]|uniref:hemolysin family protein n=1 Tax=Halobacterium salinarum TaxID=2242 RepID=UPI0025567151|nr:hemolysin family protein [Halobacterium salinarum]MDL0132878.1 hemolysin family protein [Halobacterium salinarum]